MTQADNVTNNTSTWPRLDLDLRPEALAHLARQARYGWHVPVAGGEARTVRDFMLCVLGLEPGYVEQRVSTAFLDGRAVDDFDTARVRPGSCLSLSAAMPGVAGIMMRRSSPICRMRALELVGNPDTADPDTAGPGTAGRAVEVKLFNFIAQEAGPVLLAGGLGVAAGRLAGLWADETFARGVVRAELDGRPLPVHNVTARLPADPEAMVLVSAREA